MPWTPRELGTSRLLAWYYSAGDKFLTPAAAAVVDTDNIGTWLDSSGNARNATKTTSEFLTYSSSERAASNGVPTATNLSGNESTEHVVTPSLTLSKDFAIWILTRPRESVQFRRFWGNNNTPLQMEMITNSVAGEIGFRAPGKGYTYAPAVGYGTNAWSLLMLVRTDTGSASTSRMYHNGTEMVIADPSGTTWAGGSGQLAIGDLLNNTSQGLADDIAEFGVIDGTITTNERQRIEGAALWRIAANARLPGSHPYFSGPPGDEQNSALRAALMED